MQTFITRLTILSQYHADTRTVLWEDGQKSHWENAFNKIKVNDNAIFILKDKLLFGKVRQLNDQESVLCDEIEEVNCSNDQFLQLNKAYPELISRVKANFQVFIHPIEIYIPGLIEDVTAGNFVDYFIISGIAKYRELDSTFKENDRIVLLNDKNQFEEVKLHQGNQLIDFDGNLNIQISVKGLTLDQVLEKNEQVKPRGERSNNINRIITIKKDIEEKGIYKFKTFFAYHDTLFNKRVYGAGAEVKEIISQEKGNQIRMKTPLNQILFGPPGTGKTFHTINKALSIIETVDEKELAKEKRGDIKKRFDEYLEAGRIEFVTFHQSMSYEDFIEGIKPEKSDENDGYLIYDVKPGIFKQICDRAKKISFEKADIDLKSVRYFKMSVGGKNRPDVHDYCIENDVIALGWGGDSDLSEYVEIKNWEKFRDKFAKEWPKLIEESRFHSSALYAFMNMRENDIVIVSKGNHIIDAIGVVKGSYFWNDQDPIDYYHFRKVKWLGENMDTSPDRFLRKNLSQMSIYEIHPDDIKFEALEELTNSSTKEEEKPFVLIIDEINRGNVSSIFGELITLIETDKRIGGKEELRVVLPYSKNKKDQFGVPANLHIIGTMNTADRSVEALDSALRRRFSFVEMPPDASVITKHGALKSEEEHKNGILDLDGYSVNLAHLLTTINERIEILLDRDHLIGHSYLMQVTDEKSLRVAFSKHIIPLLQEYFYGDYGKIALVLGEGFCASKKADIGKLARANDYDTSYFEDKVIYTIKDVERNDFELVSALKTLFNPKEASQVKGE